MKQRAVYWRDGDAPVDVASKPWSLDAGSERITEGAPRYCYRSAVQNLLDGSERVWEGCLEHGDLPELTTRPASRAEIASDTERCADPPEGYEKEWCDQSTLACQREFKPMQLNCEGVSKRCKPKPESEDPVADAGAPSGDAGEPRKARTRAARDSGCNVSDGPSGGSSPLLLLATAFAAAALRRRMRASALMTS